MFYVNGHPLNIPAPLGVLIFLVLLGGYAIPSIYNFWQLFTKGKKPGWAVLIPIYGPIVAAQLAKKPTALAVAFGIVSIFHYSNPTGSSAYYVAAVQLVFLLALGLPLLAGLSRQYRANNSFWVLIVLLPIAASAQISSVKYSPKKVK